MLLPQEIFVEILLRLPTRSVLRLSLVSKQWHKITCEEYFRDLHSQRAPLDSNPQAILSCSIEFIGEKGQPVISMTCPGSSVHHIIKVLPCTEHVLSTTCNGLLCIFQLVSFPQQSILVCNPLTAEYVSLPPCTAAIGFRPHCISVALGFAPVSKQYKVVCVSSPSTPLGRGIMVYTLGVDKHWRLVDQNLDFITSNQPSLVFYADGKIYWMALGPQPLHRYRLLSFDVEKEEKRLIKIVPCFNYGEKTPDYMQFEQLAGSCRISLFINYDSKIEAWELRDCDSGEGHWDRRCNIDLGPDHPRGDPWDWTERICWEWIAGIWQLGERMLIILEDNTVIFYDVPTDSIVQRLATNISMFSSLCRGYNPSLIPLRKYGSQTGQRFFDLNQELLSSQRIQWLV